MPIVIRCPSCELSLRVPDNLLGQAVQCPRCSTTITLENPDRPALPPPVPEESSERPAQRPRVEEPEEDYQEEQPSRAAGRRLPPLWEEDEEDEHRPRRRRRRRRTNATAAVAGPAIALMITGGLGIAVSVLDVILRLLGVGLMMANAGRPGRQPADPAFQAGFQTGQAVGNALGIVFDLVGICWGVLLLLGALRMHTLQTYGFAMTACILAMVPANCCCILGLPFGIWGLVVLSRPEVKDAFS